jgi:potassium/hydrogen antiporter
MELTSENIILIGSLLLLLSVFAGKTSYKFGVPTLILFLGIGMLAGSDGVGGIHFDDPRLAQLIGIISLNFILFSGGIDTNWNQVKPVMWQGVVLSTLGVMLTAGTIGIFVWYITDFTIYESLLLGSIVSSTDAAAVFSILRSKSLALKSNLRPTLEFESGSNDPMAYVLTVTFLSMVVNQDQALITQLPAFFRQMIIGALGGFVFGKLSVFVINRIKLDFEGLYPVLVIALMFTTFSATDFVGGNGFLAVYISAVYLGNQILIHKKTILKVFDGLAWLMQIVLFLTLGLLVYPSEIVPFLGVGLLISIFLIVVARPVSVFLSLSFFRIKTRNKLFISWVGLRGAVPIVFATYPLLAGIEKADMIFNIVFFISLTSVIIQGTTLGPVAKLLHVALPERVKPREAMDEFLSDVPRDFMRELMVANNSPAIGKRIMDLKIPPAVIIALIKRNGKYFTPGGATELNAGDLLIILSDKEDKIEQAFSILLGT